VPAARRRSCGTITRHGSATSTEIAFSPSRGIWRSTRTTEVMIGPREGRLARSGRACRDRESAVARCAFLNASTPFSLPRGVAVSPLLIVIIVLLVLFAVGGGVAVHNLLWLLLVVALIVLLVGVLSGRRAL
jgi:hypothetical protein